MSQSTKDKSLRVNERITAREIHLIQEDGASLGTISRDDALSKAKEVGLDLVEISPHMDPPVCKLLDYGRFRYEAQKKKNALKKKQKTVEVKEIQLRPSIAEHDYQVKLRNMLKFLEEGNKVRVILQFRGREMSRQEGGIALLERVQTDTDAVGKVEFAPKLEGRRMLLVLAPKGA